MTKVLITGGAGYLGGALTDILASSDHEVRVYDCLLYEESYRKNVPFVYGDVRDHAKLQRELDWADVVVWLAALVGDPACALNERLTMDVNVHALAYAAEHFTGKLIVMSSCSVYGATGQHEELHEASPLSPLSLYARTKIWGEELLARRPNVLQFRLGTLYGVGDTHARIRFDLVVNTLTMRAALHRKMSVFGGQQYRPFVHVKDIAALIAQEIGTPSAGMYNAHAENCTIAELAERIHRHFPHAVVERSLTMTQDNRDYRATSVKAQRELQFRPQRRIEDGVMELKDLLEGGRIKNSFVTRFSNYLHLKPLLAEYETPFGRVQTGVRV
ncbi:NAD(P)-dependent oxidoreductase [Candidatus Uhrbacteria bacterium]|nr:NAD(P)-dependent oxidoreductase [Candidatus Uhrbacteria bacterium]